MSKSMNCCRSRSSTPTEQQKFSSHSTNAMAESRLLFVLAGQSNMAGRGVLPVPDCTSLPTQRIVVLDQHSDTWRTATDPLHADKPERAGVGPGLAFAHEVLQHIQPYETIGLVPCAWGGSELARWEAGGDLYAEAVRRVEEALKAHPKSHFAGVLWHQGESDCGVESGGGSQYASRLKAVLENLRNALGQSHVPIVIGELGYFLAELAHVDKRFINAAAINRDILTVASCIGACECVSAHGLWHVGDCLHFDSQSQHKFGKRYAAAWLRLAGRVEEADSGNSGDHMHSPFTFPSAGMSLDMTQSQAVRDAEDDVKRVAPILS